MNRSPFLAVVLATMLAFCADTLSAQMMGSGGRGMMGCGMMGGRCPMCGQQWDGRYEEYSVVPEKLPKPKSEEWVNKLQEVLSLEKLSRVQYQADSEKYQVHMPYMMIIPQEDNHIQWINALFAAYGLPAKVQTPSVKKSDTATQAYEIAMQLEEDLVPHYEWLIQNAEDDLSGEVLNNILYQTRMHYMMFNHALRMGGMMGHGMGRGRMGPGMMSQ